MPDMQTPEPLDDKHRPGDDRPEEQEDPVKELNKKVEKNLKERAAIAKKRRRDTFHETWKRNVDMRLGEDVAVWEGGSSDTEDDSQNAINPDWSLTKTKTANLYSQVPTVQGTHENNQFGPAIGPFMKQLNYELSELRTNVGAAMEESLNDIVNAAGVGAVYVGYAARTAMKEGIPVIDTKAFPPELVQGLKPTQMDEKHWDNPPQDVVQKMLSQGQLPTRSVEQVVNYKFYTQRLSPDDLLWPDEFVGSNFDDGDWIGRHGRLSWAEAKNEFNLDDEEKESVLGAGEERSQSNLRSDNEATPKSTVKYVYFDEIYYWRVRVDPEEKCFDCIWKLVFVSGKDDPAVHEPWKGQQLVKETYKYVGSCIFPIQLCTITYISDNAIPPSDSQVGRPQVNDLRRSRSQMFKNRERSTPLRWMNTSLLDPMVMDNLQRGVVQGIIPILGDGSRAIGEVARASYPSEDMSFDQTATQDLEKMWQVSPSQMGQQPGRKTKSEVQDTQQNFATRMGQERNRVAMWFLRITRVLAGWMVLYSDFPVLTDQEKQAMEKAWDMKHILGDLVLKIRPDSTIVLDTQQRSQRLLQFLNMTVKSGYVNAKPIIVELAEMNGLDPSQVIVDPKPPKPEEPNISYRLSGKDDLMNPLVLAMLMKLGKAPEPDMIEKAKQLLLLMQADPQPPQPPAQPGQSGQPGQPQGGQGPHPPGPPGAQPQHPVPPENPHPSWQLGDRVAKRSRDASGG